MKTLFTLLLLTSAFLTSAKEYNIASPNRMIETSISINEAIHYKVTLNGKPFLADSKISMNINDELILGENAQVRRSYINDVSEIIKPVIKQKNEAIPNIFNQLVLEFEGSYLLEFRVFDDGVAYRWATETKDSITVKSEEVNFNFVENFNCWFPEEEDMFSHQERTYKYIPLEEINEERFCSTPMLVDGGEKLKVLISEADLEDYPGMFLKGSKNAKRLKGKFAAYPLEAVQNSDRDVKVTKYADYIAKTNGTRTFPWRLMVVTDNDAGLIESEMVFKLANPNKIEDTSWIKPGKVAWDWWNANNIYGVDFKARINTQTYKYYIDFASKYGIEYIILDEGWYHLGDVLSIKEEIDVKELIRYGEIKDVGIILWVTWKKLYDKIDEALAAYADWGVKGIKVDFMQRDDQWMVNYYHQVAQKAANHKLLVDFHGAYKPTGLRRTYPNVITREGLKGLEHSKWSDDVNPEHNTILPFIRMVAGPMDYTPGAMLNANKDNFRAVFTEPMSSGTRCHQLGLYVIFESPLQMLADNPANYMKEPECMKFLSNVPTVWNETKVLEAKVGDYVAIARRSDDAWYMGAITDWSSRELEINFDFLEEGNYKMEIWKDGINADRHAADFVHEELIISSSTDMIVRMAQGGGWVAVLTKI